MPKTNVLILGKSGSGKSSLINYLWGNAVAKTGAGRPVTPKGRDGDFGIFPFPVWLKGVELVVHDSWGIEADKAEEWNRLIKSEIQKREINGVVGNWFHTVLYCISAKGARVEDFEIKSVVLPLIEQGYSVVFVLTKSDIADKEVRQKLTDVINKECPKNGGIVQVCNVEQKLINGLHKKTFGLDELQQVIIRSLRDNLIWMVKKQYIIQCENKCRDWKRELMSFYDKEAGFFKFKFYGTVHDELIELSREKSKVISTELKLWLVKTIHEVELLFNGFGLALWSEWYLYSQNSNIKHQSDTVYKKIEFDISTSLASITMYLIPVINLWWAANRKDIHHEEISKALDSIIADYLSNAEASLVGLDNQLISILRLPLAVSK